MQNRYVENGFFIWPQSTRRGGHARAAALTPEQRKEMARKAGRRNPMGKGAGSEIQRGRGIRILDNTK